jgi:GxxExxY protein
MKGFTEDFSATIHGLSENQVSRYIVDSAIEVHRTLGGPGLLESIYEEALVYELKQRDLAVDQQVQLPVFYKGKCLSACFRIDLIINGKVIVECKAISAYNAIFEAQVLTYLRLTSLKLGLILNFGDRILKNGIHRVVNHL